MTVADTMIANFGRIASADGGSIELIEATDTMIRVGYRPGEAADCEDGVCFLPHAELEEMMRGWLSRTAPEMKLTVELM